MDWTTVCEVLNRPLDKRHVKPPAPGKYGDYIEGWWAIAEANRIFGHGEWQRDTFRLEETNRDLVETNRGTQWRVGYLAQVRIIVGDVERVGTGFGSGVSKQDSLGDAIESAAKEAETDATKRALMTFGWPFGLALYDKSKANVADGAALERQAQEDAVAATKIDLMGTCESLEELAAMWEELPRAMKDRQDVFEEKERLKNILPPKREAE